MNRQNTFDKKKVLITGGAGFIGSNLAIYLAGTGAEITILDNMTSSQGGNLFNLKPIEKDIDIDFSDIRDDAAVKKAVRGKDYIFHLARQTDHILSLTNPFTDIDVNVRGTAVLLEAIRYISPHAKLIYTGTRGQYGKAIKLPVSEDAPTNPRGIYEITNLTAEKMIQVYHDVHKIRSVMLRLTNIYGPRSQMKHDHYGIVNWFVRLAIEGKTIPLFGDGSLKRDFLYIDDAVEAIIKCTENENCYGQILNIGKDTPETFRDLAEVIVKTTGTGSYKLAPYTPERAVQEPGDFASDITKIKSLTGWKPATLLQVGIKKTVEYYLKNRDWYW